jgi:hypothetical protein
MWNTLALAVSAFFLVLGARLMAPAVFAVFSVFCFLTLALDSKFFNGELSGIKEPFYVWSEFLGMVGNIMLLIISLYYKL